MPPVVLLLAALAAHAPNTAMTVPPACRAAQLRLSLDGRGGDFDGMSHSGVELSIRNAGRDCALPALPTVEFLDRRGRPLPAARRPPVGMHPGPVMRPVIVRAGHRATADLRWVSGPVFPANRRLNPAALRVRIGAAVLRAPLAASLFGPAGQAAGFDQTPLRAAEGMPADG